MPDACITNERRAFPPWEMHAVFLFRFHFPDPQNPGIIPILANLDAAGPIDPEHLLANPD